MKDIFADEKADSMTMFVIAATVLVFGLAYTILTWTFDVPIQAINDLIASGSLTVDTTEHFETMLNLWQASPFFVLVGLVLWCFERSKGTDLSSGKFFEYLMLMIVSLIISAYMVFAYGLCMDGITSELDGVSFFTSVSSIWDTSDARGLCVSAMYWLCMLPGYLGVILFTLHPILKQLEGKTDFFGGSEDSDETVSDYQIQQL
ncbi:MAG: hypothetical protein M0R51_05190 [Clostridia bacterium]|jgi:hypothetical protein|nr:hypothetical protein [Clostridia bacterium]